MTNNQPPSEATRREVFDKHLPYEIIRLIQHYALLLNPHEYCCRLKPSLREAVHDGLLVAFCTHARTLLEFFSQKPGESYHAAATDYAEPDSYVWKNRSDVDRLYAQLCAQINHLTYERTDDSTKKIGPQEWKELIHIILSEAVRLAPHLKSGYDKQHLRIDDLRKVAGANKTEVKATLKPRSGQSILPTEAGGTTSVSTNNVDVVFFELLKAK